MSAITTHVLDVSSGKPASGISVVLEHRTHAIGWQWEAEGVTDSDGRVKGLLPAGHVLAPGHYRLSYEVGPYFLMREIDSFFLQITVSFVVKDPQQHYHVPLLLSPFGYSTYRGS